MPDILVLDNMAASYSPERLLVVEVETSALDTCRILATETTCDIVVVVVDSDTSFVYLVSTAVRGLATMVIEMNSPLDYTVVVEEACDFVECIQSLVDFVLSLVVVVVVAAAVRYYFSLLLNLYFYLFCLFL